MPTMNTTTGLKPVLILLAQRGAKAPLFHGCARATVTVMGKRTVTVVGAP